MRLIQLGKGLLIFFIVLYLDIFLILCIKTFTLDNVQLREYARETNKQTKINTLILLQHL